LDTGGILFAVFILLLGVFTLATETSFLTALVRLIRFWPLLVVGFGVWLIFKNFEQEKISVIILAALLVGAMYIAFFQPVQPPEYSDETGIPAGVTKMNVSTALVGGTFRIGSTSENLYTSEGSYPLETHVSTVGTTVDLDFSLEEEFYTPFKEGGNEHEILLYDAFPTSIKGEAVFSSCTYDLSDTVEKLSLEGVFSSFKITFGEASTKVTFDSVFTSTTLYVPQSVGVRIISDGIASFSVPSDWIKIDDGYQSPTYDTALYRIDITCDIVMGSVKIAYIELS
jgi:hypothetical protein